MSVNAYLTRRAALRAGAAFAAIVSIGTASPASAFAAPVSRTKLQGGVATSAEPDERKSDRPLVGLL